MERNHGIDALRAYAVTLVLSFHFFPGIFPGGYLGVDIFFVLSGYFIAKAVRDGSGFSARRYLARRFLRLGPALLLVLIAALVAGWWVLLPGEYISLARETLIGLGFATNFFPIGGDYFGPRIEEAALAHLWSLGVEAQVYLLAALVLPIMVRVVRPLPSYMLIAGISFAALLTAGPETDVFYNPSYRLWEFALGALAAHLIPFTGGHPGRSLRAIAIVGLAIVPFCDLEGGFGSWVLLPALVAAIAVHSAASKSSIPFPRPVVLLGQASYAVYLWHWPILVFWSIHFLGLPTPPHAVALTAVSILLGVATYLFLERPILARKASAGALKLVAVGLFIVATVAFLIDASRGAPSRLPTEAAAVLENTQRSHPRLIECHSIFPGNVLEVSDACRHNAGPGPVKTVLWGDSHAAALAGGLIRSGLDFLELSYSGCPPLPSLFIDIRGRECLDHVQQSYERIRADSDVERVIIQARWPIYLDDATNGASGGARWGALRDREGRAVQSEAAVRRLDQLVEELRGAGKRIILITPTPAFEWDLASAATRTMWHARKPLPGLSREDYSSYVASARHHLQEIAKKHGADLIDAGFLFCPDGATACPISDARGRLVMLDEDHLSAVGADLLSRAVLDVISAANTEH